MNAPLLRPAIRRSLRYSVWEGMAAMPLVYLNQPGNYLLAAMLVGTLGLSPGVYGVIVSIPFWCNFCQLFVTPWLLRHASNRAVFLATAWVCTACWLPIIGVLLWAGATRRTDLIGPLFGATYFLTCLAMSTCAVSWTSWMQSWVPLRVRGPYFAQRNRAVQASLLVFLLICAGVLHLAGATLEVFCGLFLFAVVLRVMSMSFAHRTPAPGDRAGHGTPVAEQLAVLRKEGRFLRFIAVSAGWGLTANFASPFYPVYLMQHAGLNADAIGTFFILGLLFAVLAFPAWGLLVRRYGARPVMACAVGLWALVAGSWSLVTVETRWLAFALAALAGAVNAGVVLAQFNLVLRLVPAEAKGLAIGLNTALASLATALAPMTAGWLIAVALRQGWSPEQVYRGFFLAPPLLAVVTILLLRRVTEPESAPLGRVFGAMSNVRTLGAVLGLGFLANYLFDPGAYGRLRRRFVPPGTKDVSRRRGTGR